MILPTIPTHTLIAPHYSPECRTDPTNGIAKAEAAKSFTKWWDTLTDQDVTIFSDGSEQRTDGERFVTYATLYTRPRPRLPQEGDRLIPNPMCSMPK